MAQTPQEMNPSSPLNSGDDTDQTIIKSRQYALKALKDQRAAIASEIAQLKRQWEIRRAQLVHVDATIHLLDPSVDIDAIPLKRTMKHVRLFRQGWGGLSSAPCAKRKASRSALPLSSPTS
jgi:hypothetical protein